MYDTGSTTITAVEPTDHAVPIGDLTRFFRWNEEARQYEISSGVDPSVGTPEWVTCPSAVRDRFANPNTSANVGEIVWALNNAHLREKRVSDSRLNFERDAYAAIEMIGQRLIRESENRGWCDEFDRIIDEVNESLPGPFALPVREKEYEVTWTETFTVTVHRSATYTAKSAEDAEEMAQEEDIDSSDLIDAIRNGNWESDYGDNDYEVQEV
jgi:hypothetical protein